jgi:hypothetical protein
MTDIKEELKNCIKRYCDTNEKLQEVNKIAHNLRENRKITELEMADILKTPQLSHVNVLKLENDNSMIKIQRPGTYLKPWSLSKRDLKNYLDHYFQNVGNSANPEGCFKFIVDQQKEDALSDEFKLTWVVQNENMENE